MHSQNALRFSSLRCNWSSPAPLCVHMMNALPVCCGEQARKEPDQRRCHAMCQWELCKSSALPWLLSICSSESAETKLALWQRGGKASSKTHSGRLNKNLWQAVYIMTEMPQAYELCTSARQYIGSGTLYFWSFLASLLECIILEALPPSQ